MEDSPAGLVEEFAAALDDWAREVRAACKELGFQHQQLARKLGDYRKTDPSQVSKWLSGRKIVIKGGAALPGEGLSRDVVLALGLTGPRADRLMGLGARVDHAQTRLEQRNPNDWRAGARAHLLELGKTQPPPSAATASPAPTPAPDMPPTDSDTQVVNEAEGRSAHWPAVETGAAPAMGAAGLPREVTDHAAPSAPPPGEVQTPRRRSRSTTRALVAATASTVILATTLIAYRVAATGSTAADGAQRPAGTSPMTSPTVKALPPLATAIPATSAGLGGNNRCARPRQLNGLAWTPCTRVDGTALVFALQMTNTGPDPVTVKAKLAYVRAAVEQGCPGAWGTGVELTIAPGETVISPTTECTAAKIPATAFQAKAWVVMPDEPSWGYREMSQTIHVQPDGRTALWADEA